MTAEQRAARAEFERRREERKQRQYAELRALDADLYRRSVETASAIAMRHGLSIEAAADIEWNLVTVALELAELRARVAAYTGTNYGGGH